MKRTLKLISLLLAAILLTSCLLACGDDDTSTGEVTVVLAGTEEKTYKVDLSQVEVKEGAFSIIKYLSETQGLEYDIEGTWVRRIGSVKETPNDGIYVYFWTNVEDDFDLGAYAPENKTWNGQTLTPSGKGIKEMTVKDGAVIYIGTIKF